ncbi:MAG TPA: hypothetical protein VHS06_09940 [Chloroflexota bacterium]|nr:hypothetical protein [Chloroflexota bacterium]
MYVLAYVGAALTVIWGVAHLLATRGVVADFEQVTIDNRRIVTMEWIVEGVTLVFAGALAAAVTAIDPQNAVSATAYALVIALLVVLTGVSLATGFRIRFLPFRLCPVIFMLSAVLIAIGAWL